MSQDFSSTSPMGENVPYQDLPSQSTTSVKYQYSPSVSESVAKVSSPSDKGLQKPLLLGIMGLLAFIFVVLILILVRLSSQKTIAQNVAVTPTPTPEAKNNEFQTLLPESVVVNVEQLEKNLNQVDLQELELSYPQLDWGIKY